MTEAKSQPAKKRLVKTIQYTIQLQSEKLYDYLCEEGGKSQGALERVGSLFRMLVKEEDLSNAVKDWLDNIVQDANQEVDMLKAQKDNLVEKVGVNLFEVHVPEQYKFEIEITHPSVWKLVNLINSVNAELNDIENLWLSGNVTDTELDQAIIQGLAILRRFIHKIFAATSPGKRERDGGRFSPVKFISIMRMVKGMPNIEEAIKTKEVAKQSKPPAKGKAKPVVEDSQEKPEAA